MEEETRKRLRENLLLGIKGGGFSEIGTSLHTSTDLARH